MLELADRLLVMLVSALNFPELFFLLLAHTCSDRAITKTKLSVNLLMRLSNLLCMAAKACMESACVASFSCYCCCCWSLLYIY